MPGQDNILIGQILIEEGVISADQLEKGLMERQKTGDFLCTTLVKLGFASEERVFRFWRVSLIYPMLS